MEELPPVLPKIPLVLPKIVPVVPVPVVPVPDKLLTSELERTILPLLTLAPTLKTLMLGLVTEEIVPVRFKVAFVNC